jgi:hypothetical protein
VVLDREKRLLFELAVAHLHHLLGDGEALEFASVVFLSLLLILLLLLGRRLLLLVELRFGEARELLAVFDVVGNLIFGQKRSAAGIGELHQLHLLAHSCTQPAARIFQQSADRVAPLFSHFNYAGAGRLDEYHHSLGLGSQRIVVVDRDAHSRGVWMRMRVSHEPKSLCWPFSDPFYSL